MYKLKKRLLEAEEPMTPQKTKASMSAEDAKIRAGAISLAQKVQKAILEKPPGFKDVQRNGGKLQYPLTNPPQEVGTYNIAAWNGVKRMQIDVIRAFYTEPKQNLLIYGEPGIGKSVSIKTVCKRLANDSGRIFVNFNEASDEERAALYAEPSKYFIIVDVRTALVEPVDIVGIPDIRSREKHITYKVPPFVRMCSQKDAMGILFFDEINQGEPRILKSMFQIVEDRNFNGVPLSTGMSIVAAANLGGKHKNKDLPPALTDRFGAGFLVTDAAAWLEWAEGSDEDLDLPAGVGAPQGKYKFNGRPLDPFIIAYVQANPNKNFNVKPTTGNASDKMPTPRSMEKLSIQLKKIYADYYHVETVGELAYFDEVPMIDAMAQAAGVCCGTEWAKDFINFVNYMWEYEVSKLIEDAKTHSIVSKPVQDKHAIMEWYFGKLENILEKLELNGQWNPNAKITEEDKQIMLAIPMLSISFIQTPEIKPWLTAMWKRIKNLPNKGYGKVLDYCNLGDYDPKIKKAFMETAIPTLNKLISSKALDQKQMFDKNGNPVTNKKQAFQPRI